MTPIADDISDAIKALREEIPPWRKAVEPDAPRPAFVCPDCGGTGRKFYAIPVGDPWRPCPNCTYLEKDR